MEEIYEVSLGLKVFILGGDRLCSHLCQSAFLFWTVSHGCAMGKNS